MSTFLRILCLALCLGLTVSGQAFAKSTDQTSKSDSQGKSSKKSNDKSGKKSNDKSGHKSKGKKHSKAEGGAGQSYVPRPGSAYSGGFRSLAWGTALADVPGLEVRERQGEAKYCTLPGDDMEFDGVHMREIVYVFCKDRLAGALTRYDGALTHVALMGKLNERHGKAIESPPNYRQDRSWRYDDGQTVVIVEYSTLGATGAVAYFAAGLFSPCEGMAAP